MRIRVLSPSAEQIRSCSKMISCSSFRVSIISILLYSDKRIYNNPKIPKLQGIAQMYNRPTALIILFIGEKLGRSKIGFPQKIS